MKQISILILLLLSGLSVQAQRTLIDVKMDPAAIQIGEQTVLQVSVTTDPGKDVQILIPTDTLMRGVEVLHVTPGYTTKIDNNRIIIQQNLLITSFDSSLYLLPPIRVVDASDTVASERLALKVSTVPVNVDNPDEFYDIKTVWRPAFVLADYYPYIFGVLLTLFLICVVGYLLQRRRNHQPILPQKQERILPPFEQAMSELDEIKKQKFWQRGLTKEYYTSVTETLRKYISGRFGIGAMEMTSGEILDIIRKESVDSSYDNLKQVLQLADFVKFAKFKPLPDENDLTLVNAYLFVSQTKPVDLTPPKEESVADETINDANEKKEER